MSSNVIDLVTHLKADLTEFNEGINRAQEKVSSFSEQATSRFNKMSLAIGAGVAVAAGLLVHKLDEGLEKIDNLYIASQKLGTSVSGFQELSLAVHGSGIESEQLTNMMLRLNRTIGEAQMGNEKALGTFRALGISLKDLKNNDTSQNFIAVSEALSKFNGSAKESSLAVQAFGRGGLQGMAFFNSDIEASIKHVKELNFGMSDLQAKNVHELVESLHEMGVTLEGVGMKALANFAPIMTNMLKAWEIIFNRIHSLVSSLKADLNASMNTASSFFNSQSDGVENFLRGMSKAHPGMNVANDQNMGIIGSIFTTTLKSAFNNLMGIKDSGVQDKAAEATKKFTGAVNDASTALSTIGSTLKSNDKAGIDGELKRILGDQMKAGGEGSKGVDRSDTFDHFIQQIYRNIQTSGDSVAVENQLKQAMAMADSQVSRNLGYNTAPNVGVVNDLKKYAQEQGGKTPQLEVHLKVEAADSLKVSVLGENARFATISDSTRSIFATEAAGVGK